MTTETTEATANIQQTVERSVQEAGYGSYMRYAGPVIEALVTRERAIGDKLIDYAVDAGADETEVRAYLTEIGMTVTEPQPEEPEDDDEEDDDEAENDPSIRSLLRGISTQIDSLTQFARANGYRG